MAASRVERRLAAILAADVVGYSRLMGLDEAGTLARLTALRREFFQPIIAGHHGRIVKLMGDGALVEFASVVDAVQCAVAIQRGVAERNAGIPGDRRLAFRIGINLGDVISDGDDIYGDGVNVAARLEGLSEPGGVVVSGTAYDHAKNKLDGVGFESLGEQRVKNIADPVRVYRVLLDPRAAGARSVGRARWRAVPRRWAAVAIAAIALAVASGAAAWLKPWASTAVAPGPALRAALPLPDRPSIAVLPFMNMSGDPEQEYFANGMTEDLITDLSKLSGLFVIARNSSFRYKAAPADPQSVGRELGVRYVLDGSVRRAGDEVRINAQLIDATTSEHLWAERYDGSLSDVFALQDRVTQKIVDALAVNLTAREHRAQAQAETGVPAAYDAFLKGWEHYRKRTPQHYVEALNYFHDAVELDPNYARAHAAIAAVYWKSWWEQWYLMLGTARFEAPPHRYFAIPKDLAADHLKRAMTRPTPLAHQVAAQMHLSKGRHDEAIADAEQAVTLDPSDADSRAVLAEVLIYSGKPREAIAAIDVARRLDPHNEARYSYLEAFVRFGLEQFDAAAQLLERALELGPDLWPAEMNYREADCDPCELLLAAYGYLGRPDEQIQTMRDRLFWTWGSVGLSVRSIVAYRPFKEPGDAERLAEGLRRAGLPEY